MSDYERVARAITYIAERVSGQPTLQEVAAHVHLSPFHFQRLFSRWAGVTPKRFLQVLTVERAKALLRAPHSLLDVSYTLGLGSGSRLYDHFVRLEAVTPGEFRAGGEGVRIEYGVHETPFGAAWIAASARGICSLEFLDEVEAGAHLADLSGKWPRAAIQENRPRTRALIDQVFRVDCATDKPLSLYVRGTNFQVKVWKALMQIPSGTVVSYAEVAKSVGHPRAARAVGRAMGENPVAFLIPCHRVIRQSGELAGYRWGETRKLAIHAWEAAKRDPVSA